VFQVNTPIKPGVVKEVKQAVSLNDTTCICGKWQTVQWQCSYIFACCAKNHINFTQFVDDHYMIQSYISSYNMPFHPLLDELEWTNYTRPRVKTDLYRWEYGYGWQMSTHLHNEMDAREGHTHYRYGICNDICHNKKTCSNQQSMYDNTIVYKIYIIYLSCYGILLYFYTY
jgi:hypothetical protein